MKLNKIHLRPLNKIGVIASLSISLIGCGSSQSKDPLESFTGVWQQQGSGDIWQFTTTELNRFNINTVGCVGYSIEKFTELQGLEQHLSTKQGDLYLENDATNPFVFKKMTGLPEACEAENQLKTEDPVDNFEFFWHQFNEYYAFFELYGINWQQVYQQYRPAITSETTEAELIATFDEIISKFRDSHVGLDIKEQTLSGDGAIRGLPMEALKYLVLSGEENIDELFEPTYEQFKLGREALASKYIDGGQLSNSLQSDAMAWGTIKNHIGYLRIERESQILKQNENSDKLTEILNSATQDLNDTEVLMTEVMSNLSNTDAMIIDLRLNEGGYDKVSQKIASYFNDVPRTFATKQSVNKKYSTSAVELTIDTVDTPYTKPIYVITGESNVSAGEVLSMALNSIPHVTLVGQPTNGSVSDIANFTLPNGWQGALSNQRYYDIEGEIIEGKGVIPDHSVPVYAVEDFDYGSDNAIDFILQQLGQSLPFALDLAQLEQQIEQTRAELQIPGLSVAIVQDGEIVFEKGFGEAVIGSGTSVTEHTPFNIGSISKAVLGTAIAQKIEQNKLNLDMPLSTFNLPFSVGHPNATEQITLRQLVTHTSGIADTLAYNCNYFIHGTELSLYAAFGAEHCPQEAIVDPTSFYQAYFSEFGGLNNELPYVATEPGLFHSYSNVGAGLAAYAIEQYLGIDFSEDMKSSIFQPLGMVNTSWKHTDLIETRPKATQYTLTQDNEALEIPEYSYPTFYDGDLNSSAHDLARLMLALSAGGAIDDNRILDSETVSAMFSNQTGLTDFRSEKQGLFWFLSGAFIGHTGGDPGTSATMQYNPTTKTGFVFMMNIEDDNLGNEVLGQQLAPLIASLYHTGVSH